MTAPNPSTQSNHSDEEVEREWEALRIWVQQYSKYIRISQVAVDAGMSVEMAQALLLRDKDKTRIPRTKERLESLLAVFTRPPFCYPGILS
jgi:hypothetical protein